MRPEIGSRSGGVDLDVFSASLDKDTPPEHISDALVALWHAAKGNWDTAHKLAQVREDATGCWVHAYLHRVEGDERNAGQWYRKAGKPFPTLTIEEEWRSIAAALLDS